MASRASTCSKFAAVEGVNEGRVVLHAPLMDADVLETRVGRQLMRRPYGEQERFYQEPLLHDVANAVPSRHVNRP